MSHRYFQVDESSNDDEDADEEDTVRDKVEYSKNDWDSMWQKALFEMPKETTREAEVLLSSPTASIITLSLSKHHSRIIAATSEGDTSRLIRICGNIVQNCEKNN